MAKFELTAAMKEMEMEEELTSMKEEAMESEEEEEKDKPKMTRTTLANDNTMVNLLEEYDEEIKRIEHILFKTKLCYLGYFVIYLVVSMLRTKAANKKLVMSTGIGVAILIFMVIIKVIIPRVIYNVKTSVVLQDHQVDSLPGLYFCYHALITHFSISKKSERWQIRDSMIAYALILWFSAAMHISNYMIRIDAELNKSIQIKQQSATAAAAPHIHLDSTTTTAEQRNMTSLSTLKKIN